VNPRLAVLAVIPVLLHLHLSVAVAGTVVTVSVPWLLILALIFAAVLLAWLTARNLRGFRSSPYPRTVT
jgi:hypothetical protein